MNPYLILGVPRDAGDARIRQAYLDAVRQTPPETHPERFKAVAAAYEKINDETARHRFELFDPTPPAATPLAAFLGHARLEVPRSPPRFEHLKAFLRTCSKP